MGRAEAPVPCPPPPGHRVRRAGCCRPRPSAPTNQGHSLRSLLKRASVETTNHSPVWPLVVSKPQASAGTEHTASTGPVPRLPGGAQPLKSHACDPGRAGSACEAARGREGKTERNTRYEPTWAQTSSTGVTESTAREDGCGTVCFNGTRIYNR